MTTPRSHIRFLLNSDEVVLADMRPDETLLDYLRLRRRLVGTKEGCAEGDCGACTVLVGRLTRNGLVYEGVNACIRFLGSLDACHVVTVEHLKRADGTLHPVQQALVDFHGSQCGFCTPGFVMSLYALWMRNPEPDDAAIEKALQGNLCRCTGYEPIVKAARAISSYGEAGSDALATERRHVMARLREMKDGARVEIGEGASRILIPASVDDLAAILDEEPRATVVAGSTDVGLWATKFLRAISPAVFVGGLDELRDWSERDGETVLGAGVSYTEAYDILDARIPALGRLVERIGGDQIRNMGTVGGNIANGSPIGDMPPPLIALGATLTLRSAAGRRSLPLEDYFIAYGSQDRRPDEFVEQVSVPKPHGLFDVYKVSKRRDEDITSVLGAFHVEVEGGKVASARIAYGGMAATPKRARAAEFALVGRPWTEETVQKAMDALAEDFSPISDMRASAEYRMLVAQNLLRRFWLEKTTEAPMRLRRFEEA